jgi:CRISPR-associated protein Cas1
MQLVINTWGSYLQKSGNCFKVKVNERVFEVACNKVSSILISTAAYITTDAIKMAMESFHASSSKTRIETSRRR